MAKYRTKRESEGDEPVNLDCFKNQPNINMAIPWIYEIAKTMTKNSRDPEEADEKEDEKEEEGEPVDLDCFLNQPNINMTIPWIYQIYKAVKSGGGGGGGGGGGSDDLEWEDITDEGEDGE